MVKVKKEELERVGVENETTKAIPAEDAKNPKGQAVKFIWVKLRAYVDEAGTKRIDKGLYQTAEVFPRLEGANAGVCEIFEGEIPERKLIEIAKAFGVSTDNKDLLNALVTKSIVLF